MIFVTGGAGYIGSHTCVELLDAGCDVTVFGNFSYSHPEALARVERVTGKTLRLVRGDIRDRAGSAVIHFAGLKAVGESVAQPLVDQVAVGRRAYLNVWGNEYSTPGDIPSCYADTQRACELLGWRAEQGLSAMCADAQALAECES